LNPGQRSPDIKLSQSQSTLLRAEALRLLHSGLPASLLANTLLSSLLVYVQWPAISHTLAIGWLALFGIVLTLRTLMYLGYKRAELAPTRSKADFLWRFRLGAIATGVVWGLHGLLLFPADDIPHQVFLAFVLAGVSSGAITSLNADRISALGFVIPAVLPLIPQLFMTSDAVSFSMGVIVVLYLAFIVASSKRLQHQLHENVRLRAESAVREMDLRHQQQLNGIIAHTQSQFIKETHHSKAFDGLLADILALTESEYGFIDEILPAQSGKPYLKTSAMAAGGDDAVRTLHAEKLPQGMTFSDLDAFFGKAQTNDETLISNTPHDPRSGVRIDDHPDLTALLRIPILHGDERVAMIGMANRPGGYDQELIGFLQPLLITLGQLVAADRIKQQSRMVKNELARFKSTLDRTLDCVFMFDAINLEFFYVNEGAMRQVGYSLDELLVMHPYDIKPNFTKEQFKALIVPLLSGKKDSLTVETVHQHKNGEQIPVEIFLQYIAPENESARFVAIVRDITERKRVERMKSEFVSTVSHELRTPLTAISGALGLLSGGALGTLPEQAGAMIAIADKNGKRLAFLINDLLDMEKLASGKMHFDMQAQPLMPLLEQALEANQAYGAERQVTLDLTGRMPGVMVSVDGQRIMQVLSNLLSNAVKYSPEKGSVEVAASLQEKMVRVTITDHGPGIPVAFRDRIFQKFAQADASDSRQKSGTGLGLAITRELIERMGGQIGFDSVENKGTSFFFDLPIQPENADTTTGL